MDRPEGPGGISRWTAENGEAFQGGRWQPAVDLYETEKAVIVRAEIAGVSRDGLKVTVHGQRLLIRGERVPPAAAEESLRPHRMEIALGPFERRLEIPVPFEADRVSASLEDGLLTVTLPKRQPPRTRIPVKDSEETS